MVDYTVFINKIAPLAQADMKKNGVLASVTIAQAILESAGGTSELYKAALNAFGMKTSLSGNTWSDSTWDGVSKYTKQTEEQDSVGNTITVTADFRKYPSLADSIGDHSAYLVGAKNGTSLRYAGLKGENDPQTAMTIIKNGGYATDVNYVTKVMNIINTYSLTKYDSTGGNSMSINITQKNGTANTTAASGRTISYIVIHYTAGVSSKSGKAADTAAWFANSSAQASADFIVDDATIIQYNPDPKNRYCWAVGGAKQSTKGGSLYGIAKNANSVNIEICSTNSTGTVKNANDSTWSLSDAAVNNAVELTKYLMSQYGIAADHVIRHYDVNGKLCPGVVSWNADSGSEAKWTAFKAKLGSTTTSTTTTTTSTTASTTYYRVRKTWADASSQLGAYTSLANAKAKADANSGYYVFDDNGNVVYPTSSTTTVSTTSFKVKVTATNLNIRVGAGTDTAKTGKICSPGTYTIVETASGTGASAWYKLKSGAGWISADYCTKIS